MESQQAVLIFDIDHTLVHAIEYQDDPKLYKKLKGQKNPSRFRELPNMVVVLRPYVREFISLLATKFKIAFWSAGSKWYVNQMVDFVYPKHLPAPVFVWDRQTLCLNGTKRWYMLQQINPQYQFILIDDLNMHNPHILAHPYIIRSIYHTDQDSWLQLSSTFEKIFQSAGQNAQAHIPRIVKTNGTKSISIKFHSWGKIVKFLHQKTILHSVDNKIYV